MSIQHSQIQQQNWRMKRKETNTTHRLGRWWCCFSLSFFLFLIFFCLHCVHVNVIVLLLAKGYKKKTHVDSSLGKTSPTNRTVDCYKTTTTNNQQQIMIHGFSIRPNLRHDPQQKFEEKLSWNFDKDFLEILAKIENFVFLFCNVNECFSINALPLLVGELSKNIV